MNARTFRLTIGLCLLLAASFLLSSCYFANLKMNEDDLKAVLSPHEDEIGQSTQMILVREKGFLFSSVYLVYAMEKADGHWKCVSDPIPAKIGRNGFALLGEKREGDGKTPSGIFSLKRTFGYEETVRTKMPYRQVSEADLWVDDPNAPDYNRWVKQGETSAGSYEKMKREDDQYKYGIVIEYNTDPVIKGHGSAIFFHVWMTWHTPTAGCVAVSEEDMIRLLVWLNPDAFPLIIMGVKS